VWHPDVHTSAITSFLYINPHQNCKWMAVDTVISKIIRRVTLAPRFCGNKAPRHTETLGLFHQSTPRNTPSGDQDHVPRPRHLRCDVESRLESTIDLSLNPVD